MKPLLMFCIKGKTGTHAVSCHIVVLAWETCQQEAGGRKKERSFVFFAWKEAGFHGNNPETPHTEMLYSYT